VELADVELQKSARILERMIELRAASQDTSANSAPPPSPTYSEFFDLPSFSSCPVTPVDGNERLPELDGSLMKTPEGLFGTQQPQFFKLSSPIPNRKHYSVAVGRRTGVYASW
jgi:hypothetical protein